MNCCLGVAGDYLRFLGNRLAFLVSASIESHADRSVALWFLFRLLDCAEIRILRDRFSVRAHRRRALFPRPRAPKLHTKFFFQARSEFFAVFAIRI